MASAIGKAHNYVLPPILVVDDEPAMCLICERVLKQNGYEVEVTTSGHTALELLQNRTFSLLLTDIHMPQLSGLELAQQARAIDPRLAVIVMSGQTTLETLREAVQQGIANYLSKPFEIEELRLTVAQALRQRSMVQEVIHLETVVHQLQLTNEFRYTLSLDELCATIVRTVSGEIGSRDGYFLLHAPGDEPRLLHSGERSSQIDETGWQVLQTTFDRQQIYQTSLQLDDAPCDVVCLPLQVGRQPIGSALFDHYQPLTNTRTESLMLLLSHAAAALNNARLYTRLHEAHQQLQELDRLKGEFISITSHELRTPLAIMLGYAMILRDQLQTDKQREFIQRILDSGHRINEIVDDMTHLRMLEHRQATLELQSLDVPTLINTAIVTMQPLANAKMQSIVFECATDRRQAVVADQVKLDLVINSLLSNAIKFTSVGGGIRIASWIDEVRSVPYERDGASLVLTPGTWIFISVTDSGIGIPPTQRQRIFERFHQVASSLTREHGGTGLGLALVHGLVTLHDGQVWVTSEEGRGSTFTVALPQRGPRTHDGGVEHEL